jgi:metallo-beta-lactamase class B
MVKSLGSGKGNLADADTLAWAGTVRKVMELVNDSTTVIPGHGKHGGRELLEYTVGMFGGE